MDRSGVTVDFVSPVTGRIGYEIPRTVPQDLLCLPVPYIPSIAAMPSGYDGFNRVSKLEKIITEAEKMERSHRLAILYYNIWFYLDAIIALILGFTATIIALLIGILNSENTPDNEKIKWLGFADAVITALGTLITGLFVAFGIPTKTSAFKKSYMEYRDLVIRLHLYRYDNEDIDSIVQWYQKKVLKINERNKFPLPWILL